MKNLRLLGFLMMLASSSLFVNCTSDPIAGPDGTAGIDGTDGLDGLDGLDSTADCRSCHSVEHRDPINAEYAISHHAVGPEGENAWEAGENGSWERGTGGSCAQCHSNEGFIDFQEMGFVSDAGLTNNPITCNGCHNPIDGHRSFDFDSDGNDYALRTFAPVSLIVDESIVLDATNDSDVMGASNNCINCHQPRRSGPIADTDGKYLQTSGHWGPHHGPQSTLLEGIQGMEIAGTEVYPAAGDAGHSKGSSCVACHMSEGGHSWEPSSASSTTCTSCHDVITEVDGYAAQMETLAGLLALSSGQKIAKDADGDYQPVFEADGTTPVMVTGIVHDGHPETGLFDIKDAEAGWNYLFLLEDKSKGVHNPKYAKALLQNSIEALQ